MKLMYYARVDLELRMKNSYIKE